MNRRQFMKTGIWAGAATVSLPRRVTAAAAPADGYRVGILGSGARAQHLLQAAQSIPNVEIIAVCDAYRGRAERSKALTDGKAGIYDDYRRILDQAGVDAVIIGSPDHWHRQMCLDALAAGKDVYVEKPLTYRVEEGLEIMAAVRRTGRILQVGSQPMSSATQEKAREIVASGRLGQITMVRASYNRNTASGAWLYPIPPDASPQTVNWKQFLGPAPDRPFDLERFFRWRCYWDYSGGIATDLFVHLVTSLHFILDAQMPKSVTATGELHRWKDTHEVPDTVNGILVYPEGFTLNLSSTFNNQVSSESGFEILGTKGSISFREDSLMFTPENVHEDNRWVVDSWPEDLAREYYSKQEVQARESPGTWRPQMQLEREVYTQQGHDDTLTHLQRFFESVQTRQTPVQDAVAGHRAAACAHMINQSLKSMKTVYWDFAGEKVAG